MVMQQFPPIDVLTLFNRFDTIEQVDWRPLYRRDLKKVIHVKTKTSKTASSLHYSFETKQGDFVDLVFDQVNLTWTIDKSGNHTGYEVDRVLALFKATRKDYPHIIPYRFELLPEEVAKKNYSGTEKLLMERLQPYRFQTKDQKSIQVVDLPTKHLEDIKTTKHLNYVVKSEAGKFYHILLVLNKLQWIYMQEVPEELFFY